MHLSLEILRSADPDLPVGSAQELDSDESRELALGRAKRSDIRMANDDLRISKSHARVYFEQEDLFLADSSTNGTVLNDEVLKGEVRQLEDGDCIVIGPYEFRVNIEDPIHMPSNLFDEDDEENALPAPDPNEQDFFDPWGPDEVQNPPTAPPAWPPRHPLSEGPESNVVLRPPGPVVRDENVTTTPVFNPVDFDPSPLLVRDDEPTPAPVDREKPGSRQPTPILPRPPLPGPVSPPLSETDSGTKCWEAFLRGAQMDDDEVPAVTDHIAHFERMGQLFQLFVSGTLQLMKARDAVRNHFGMENTIFHSEANNPLKLTNVESALANLLRPREARGYMEGETAVDEAMKALAQHEHALIAATRDGLDSLFEPLRPQNFELEKGTGRASWFAGLGARGRAWEGFCQEYERYVGNRSYMDKYREQFSKTYEEELEAHKHQSSGGEHHHPANSKKQSKIQ